MIKRKDGLFKCYFMVYMIFNMEFRRYRATRRKVRVYQKVPSVSLRLGSSVLNYLRLITRSTASIILMVSKPYFVIN